MGESLGVSKESNKHLIEGVRPIFVAIGTPEDFERAENEHPEIPQKISNNFGLKNLKNVDWENGTYGAPYWGESGESGSLVKPKAYIISPIDNSNKFSTGVGACTGLIVAGKDKHTGENISFATHQASFFLENFETDLNKRLMEMKERCAEGTIDAVIIGGVTRGVSLEKIYTTNMKFLSGVTQKILKFEPVIVNGPKKGTLNNDDFFYDNEHRRVYLVRS
jgi:hypothetical protein